LAPKKRGSADFDDLVRVHEFKTRFAHPAPPIKRGEGSRSYCQPRFFPNVFEKTEPKPIVATSNATEPTVLETFIVWTTGGAVLPHRS
jgi:hypothetical protein